MLALSHVSCRVDLLSYNFCIKFSLSLSFSVSLCLSLPLSLSLCISLCVSLPPYIFLYVTRCWSNRSYHYSSFVSNDNIVSPIH